MDTESKNRSLGVLLAVMTLSHAVSAFCDLSIPPLPPFLRDELHLTRSEVGLLRPKIFFFSYALGFG